MMQYVCVSQVGHVLGGAQTGDLEVDRERQSVGALTWVWECATH